MGRCHIATQCWNITRKLLGRVWHCWDNGFCIVDCLEWAKSERIVESRGGRRGREMQSIKSLVCGEEMVGSGHVRKSM